MDSNLLVRLATDRTGTSAVEYAILLGIIAVTLTVAIPPAMDAITAMLMRLAILFGGSAS
ncbi:hypothetical protein [Azospirillum sp. B510]|uniref:hypothetical protein n=1 Tax=Azospirillum sp. (strain B510) TaxID=137722 RepID=UPI00031E7098|nr:hypothetical protein [Azospirillum sp. B510]